VGSSSSAVAEAMADKGQRAVRLAIHPASFFATSFAKATAVEENYGGEAQWQHGYGCSGYAY